jgi:hypothetical protein
MDQASNVQLPTADRPIGTAKRAPAQLGQGSLHDTTGGPRPSYDRACRYCGDSIRLVWLPEEKRYEPQSRADGIRHVCSAEAFKRKRVVCSKCGVPVLTQRERTNGRVTVLEIDATTRHVCSRRATIRIIHAPAETEPPPEAETRVARKRPIRDSARDESDQRFCPACGQLLPASGKYRSCFHCGS